MQKNPATQQNENVLLLPAINQYQALEPVLLEGVKNENFTSSAMDYAEKKFEHLYNDRHGQKARTAQQNLEMKHSQKMCLPPQASNWHHQQKDNI